MTGVDAAPELIEIAKSRESSGHWIATDMRGLDLQARFNGILAWHSLFHLRADDQRAMFAVFTQHAKKGTVLMFTSGLKAGEAIGNFEGEPLYHASLDAQEYHALLNEYLFDVIEYVPEDPDCGGATVWLAQYIGGDQGRR